VAEPRRLTTTQRGAREAAQQDMGLGDTPFDGLQPRDEPSSTQRLLDEADRTSYADQAGRLTLPGLDRCFHDRALGDVSQPASRLAEALVDRSLARLDVQDRKPRQHHGVPSKRRIAAKLGRAQVEQPGDRGVLPVRCVGRAHLVRPARRADGTVRGVGATSS